MQSNQIVVGLLVIYIVYSAIKLNEAATFKLTNAVCQSYNNSWVTINNCRLKAIQRDKTEFNFNGTLLHKAKNISLSFQLFKRLNGYKPWLMKGKVDVCRFLIKPYNPYMILFYNLFKDFTNFNKTCPLVGHHIVKGFYLRPELMPLPVPTGEYMFSMRWSFDNKLQFDTNVSASFVENLI